MNRRKSAPKKRNNPEEDWNLVYKPIDHFPFKKRRNRTRGRTSNVGPFYKVVIPSEKNQQFNLGKILVGTTNNELPENWSSCRISFFVHEDTHEEHVLITLDTTSIIVKLLPGNDLIKEIVISKIFAISVLTSDNNLYLDIYFCDLPLPKFSKRIGTCIQTVLSLLSDISPHSDNDEDEVDLSSEYAITQLYKNIRMVREKEQKLECEDVQHVRLKPQLRPYQADAVRWMLYRERKHETVQNDLHPLYTIITLKSGVDIYYDKYSGFVDITKPIVDTSTRGGILADEMGLGKTVEVLGCILLHPKPDSTSDTVDLEKSPIIEHMSKKRKMEVSKPPEVVDNSKKLKVPDDWVKPSSKKSQTFVALQMWYNSVLFSPQKNDSLKDEHALQCICGGNDQTGSVTCIDCAKIQHGACLGYKKSFGSYRCPQCWMNQPLIESKATLIVTPVSLRTQWCKEVCRHIKGDLKVLQYGGNSLTPIYPTELTKYDIVITTYSVLQSELRLTENEKELSFRHHRRYSAPGSPLTRIKWWRLCLDEAQTVETPTSMVSAMAKKLSAHFRWAVTGTPIAKEISDLHGLIDYLQMEPYNDIYTWEQLLFNPYIKGQTAPMLKFLSEVLWRSSKDEVIDQINIPKQIIKEHWLDFSTIEFYFYRCEHQFSRNEFLDRAKSYQSEIPIQSLDKKSLKTVLAPLLSLRQICSYPNSLKARYLATKKPVKSMKDLLEALVAKNTNESEELLRVALSALNGLAGIYLLLQSPEQAIEEYRTVLQLYTRFTEEEKIAKLSIDKLQVIHAMHNLAEALEVCPVTDKTLRDESLRKDCLELEKKYIEKFINQSMTVLQESLLISSNIENLQNSFTLDAGRWYSDLLEWIYVHSYDQELYTRIENLHSVASIECTIDFRNARSLIYAVSSWDDHISNLRETTIQAVNDLYTHCPDDEFQVIVSQELVQHATNCHLRPLKKSKNKKKCPVCVCNDHLKSYELQLFSMTKRTTTFEDMSLRGSWKPTPQELIFRAILAIGRAKNANNDFIKDGEVHVNILDTLKKEFKEVRKLWTFLDQQICAQDELDICKTRLRLKEPSIEEKAKDKVTPILKNLAYTMNNKLETINLLSEHELEHERIVLHNEHHRRMALLEKNLGVRNYLETLHQQHHENVSPDPCPICKNALGNHWGIVPCGHSYCLECIQHLINESKAHHDFQCSICRVNHSISEISYTKIGEQNTETESTKIQGNYSTKVESIVKLIMDLKSEDSDVKVLIFSSWVSVLNYVREALTNNDILTELVSSSGLEKQIEKFKDVKQHITALLLPIQLGGKGLNLIEATHVILIEPLLNPADELQAIGRVHRIGQTRTTVVHKFFIKNTIEESIQKAVSTDTKNWEKNKVTIGQLMDLFFNSSVAAVESQASA